MRSDLTALVTRLEELVAFRSDIEGDERPLVNHLAALLRERGADRVVVADAPRGAAHARDSSYVFASFGEPKLVINAHIDTVPPNQGWTSDPWKLSVQGDRLVGLGAADTKGAVAAVLAAIDAVRAQHHAPPKNVGILFSGDEEFSSASMRAFVRSAECRGIERAIVCEPTLLRVGTRHRGLLSFAVTAQGPGGHSSHADHVPSPLATLARVATGLDDWGRAHRDEGPPGFAGMCMNLASLEGGVAFNVIAARARLEASLRPPPGAMGDARDSLARASASERASAPGTEQTHAVASIWASLEHVVRSCAGGHAVQFERLRNNLPFQTCNLHSFERYLGHRVHSAIDLGFWTEAALLANAGVDAVVIGPGDIAQAHGPDEWVSVAQLEAARDMFTEALARGA